MRQLLLEIMTGQCKVANMHSLDRKLMMNCTGKEHKDNRLMYRAFHCTIITFVIQLRKFNS